MGSPHLGGRNSLTVRADYFPGEAVPTTWDPAKAPVGGRDLVAPPLHWFVWSLGSIIISHSDNHGEQNCDGLERHVQADRPREAEDDLRSNRAEVADAGRDRPPRARWGQRTSTATTGEIRTEIPANVAFSRCTCNEP